MSNDLSKFAKSRLRRFSSLVPAIGAVAAMGVPLNPALAGPNDPSLGQVVEAIGTAGGTLDDILCGFDGFLFVEFTDQNGDRLSAVTNRTCDPNAVVDVDALLAELGLGSGSDSSGSSLSDAQLIQNYGAVADRSASAFVSGLTGGTGGSSSASELFGLISTPNRFNKIVTRPKKKCDPIKLEKLREKAAEDFGLLAIARDGDPSALEAARTQFETSDAALKEALALCPEAERDAPAAEAGDDRDTDDEVPDGSGSTSAQTIAPAVPVTPDMPVQGNDPLVGISPGARPGDLENPITLVNRESPCDPRRIREVQGRLDFVKEKLSNFQPDTFNELKPAAQKERLEQQERELEAELSDLLEKCPEEQREKEDVLAGRKPCDSPEIRRLNAFIANLEESLRGIQAAGGDGISDRQIDLENKLRDAEAELKNAQAACIEAIRNEPLPPSQGDEDQPGTGDLDGSTIISPEELEKRQRRRIGRPILPKPPGQGIQSNPVLTFATLGGAYDASRVTKTRKAQGSVVNISGSALPFASLAPISFAVNPDADGRGASLNVSQNDRQKNWRVYLRTRFDGLDDDRIGATVSEELFTVTLGGGLRLGPKTAVGGDIFYRTGEVTTASVNTRTKGDYYGANLQVAHRLADNARVSGGVAYIRGENDLFLLAPDLGIGSFDVESFSANATLQADIPLGPVTLVPTANVTFNRINREAFVAQDVLDIPERNFSSLRANAGVDVKHNLGFDLGSASLKPRLGVFLDFQDRDTQGALLANGNAFERVGLGAQANAGFDVQLEDGLRLSVVGNYGYYGSNLQRYGAQVQLSFKLP